MEYTHYVSEIYLILVINAQHTFYNGTTEVTVKRNERSIRQNVGPLHSVSNPEDKRKIIGDMFVKVNGTSIVVVILKAVSCFEIVS